VGEKGDIALSVIPYKIERYFLWAGSLRKYRTFIITPRPLKTVWFCEVKTAIPSYDGTVVKVFTTE
jgi:hypothetical protein